MRLRSTWVALLLLCSSACSSGVDAPPVDDGGAERPPADDPPPVDAPDDSPPAGDDDPPAFIAASSLTITDLAGLRLVEQEFPMGRLMLDIGAYIQDETERYNATHTDQRKDVLPDDFAVRPFVIGSKDIQRHNTYTGLKVGVTPVVADAYDSMVINPGGVSWVPTENPRGNFRLLAVVNRLDLAGEWDRREGGQFAGLQRRWFGEGRLVFGVASDRDDGPYPMTFIVEYRLPALEELPDGSVRVDEAFDYDAGPVSEAAWKEGRALWARVWRELSDSPRDSDVYRRKLHDVVALFARGSGSLGLRGGQRLMTPDGQLTNEFEYREHYLNATWRLSNRKVQREPFRCAQNSEALAARVEADWNDAEGTIRYDSIMGERNLDRAETEEITALCGGEIPYGQGAEDDEAEDMKPPYQLRAKFARFQLGDVWQTLLPEPKRHEFALVTCTGCHAGETASAGFLVSPRGAREPARLAAFLTGGAEYTSGGVTYRYDELARRAKLLEKFLAREDVPVEMLGLTAH